ncbi:MULTISPECIES: Qat anti-phage system TatD family nuclease QatD [unclassified Variovorax]|uniref:Qat anti-phage system TatD family nuclease QatD n=1 Tax=unclassified Variovorax TaxID=663243 RepID=UPI000B84CEFD|nr:MULTISPECIES: Qat anti-phage system TatD family nuclease QatD [unclassified Variovorax]
MIDFHSHLDLYPNGLELAREVNIRNEFTLVVTTSPRAYHATSRVFAGLQNIKVGLGLHPEVAEPKATEVDALVGGVTSVRFIGEIGLDGSPRFRKTMDLQERIFQAVLDECKRQGGRIISIHSRGAASRVIELIARAGALGFPVLHWFSGGLAELQAAARLGCWFSVGPAMLASEKGRALAARMPLNRVLPETDGPFAMHRGEVLKPWDAWSVCGILADLWAVPITDVEQQFRSNLEQLLFNRS